MLTDKTKSPRYHTIIRKAVINFGLLLGSILLFFFGIEITLRVTKIQTVAPNPPPIYRTNANPSISYELKPNLDVKALRAKIVTNAQGFRSPPISEEEPLVAVLGDSVTFGYGLKNNETLPARLQELLPGIQMLNAAVPGYNLTQEAATYETKIAPLHPSILVLVFYFNDFDFSIAWLDDLGILRAEGWKPHMQECEPVLDGILGLLPGKCWLDTHSAFYKFVKKLVITRTGVAETVLERTYSLQHPDEDPVTVAQLSRYRSTLRKFASTLPNSLPRLFVIWPDNLMHAQSRPRLKEMAKESGFSVVDLYETFGNQMSMLSGDTVHPSKESVAKAAEVIAEAMRTTGIGQ
ncbi:MAG: hypothetical protein PHH13_02200 [Candidatus Peribacteraceae bacterium]|nr:hypothetical protein [Candidatus Peribacteraceae bacterium]